ncbi:MAG: isochorismatase family protein [Pirellulaceae bacterium]|nr:isochorismatase family protein [Pirellulaceae bacterium]MDP7020690.1 isochorismatase family protein [Pirellulaceae bacterium]
MKFRPTPFRAHCLLATTTLTVATLTVAALSLLAAGARVNAAESFDLELRKRVETGEETGSFQMTRQQQTWQPAETAVVVCDMWDLHHCLNATKRGAEMAPRMDRVLKLARARGATIIHAPSSCVKFYADHPARKHVQTIPRADTFPTDIGKWCHIIPSEEQGEYPIDQSDGGEDDDPEEHKKWAEELKAKGLNPRAPWTRQTKLLTIADKDFISDNGEEIWSILEHRKIKNVVLVGVHTNMCVLGRPFGLRQMARNEKNVVLMRDMTDTMYNPARRPYVSHFTGTDLIVEHIEKWVCPTITSDQLLGGKPFRFKNDTRPHVVALIAEREYKTNQTLPRFALERLGKDFRVSFVFANPKDRDDLPGAERLIPTADLLLVSVRRRALNKVQMDALRKHVAGGKPVVGIRTANHAFSLRGKEAPKGRFVWERWDRDVIGGHYTNHHGDGPNVKITVAKKQANHSILKGVDRNDLVGHGSLYVVSPLGPEARPLLLGQIPDKPVEPIAWTNTTEAGGRVFYTSLGHIEDFQHEAVKQLLDNAIRWAVKTR